MTDDRRIQGGHVITPVPGCYRGVVVIDANSLYPSLMRHMGIFIDRCTSAASVASLEAKIGTKLPETCHGMRNGDVIVGSGMVVMRTMYGYIAVIKGEPTMLSEIIEMLTTLRREAQREGNEVAAEGIKVLSNGIYGSMTSRHGILSSKTCAEATKCAARFFLREMVAVTPFSLRLLIPQPPPC